MILLAGFGPFGQLQVNPAGQLARALDGSRVRGHTVLGEVMPVSFRRSAPPMIAACRALRPLFVLGVGVALRRSGPTVEARAGRLAGPQPDVDGYAPPMSGGPEHLSATLPPEPLCAALGATVSQDAGDYVCNGWLYRMLSAPGLPPVGFLHVPTGGVPRGALGAGLAGLVEALEGTDPSVRGSR